MIKVSRKRIAAFLLAASILFTQNSTVVFAEEVNSAADITNENVVNNVKTAVEETTDNNSEESVFDNSNAADSTASDDATTQERDTSNSTSINEEPAEAQQETTSEDVKNESTSDEDFSKHEDDSTPAATNETDDFNSFANQFDDGCNEESVTEDSMVMESKILNASNSGHGDWYKDYDYSLNKEEKSIILNSCNASGDVYVYNSALIDGVQYNTYVNAWVFKAKKLITSISFQPGCKTKDDIEHFVFTGCENVVSIDLSGIQIRGVYDADDMFAGCSKLEELELGNFGDGLFNLEGMFEGCASLKYLDLRKISLEDMSCSINGMFSGCTSLQYLDLSSFDTSGCKMSMYVTRRNHVVSDCTSLEVFISPKNNYFEFDLPGEFVIDNDEDGISDDGKTYSIIEGKSASKRYVRKNTNSQSVVEDGFDLTKHGHAVINRRTSFGYEGNYYIPEPRYEEVFSDYDENMYTVDKGWHGNCFGMSITAALFYKNKLNLADYAPRSGEYLNDTGYVGITNKESDNYLYLNIDSELTKLIERYQVWQDSSEFINSKAKDIEKFSSAEKRKVAFSNIIESIKNDKEPYYLSVGWVDSDGEYGHAMIVDSCRTPEDEGNGWVKIFLYDPNYPYNADIESKKLYYPYEKATDRYVEVNTNSGAWRMSASLNMDGNSCEYIGQSREDSLINGTRISFSNVSNYPSGFGRRISYADKGNSSSIRYNSKSFTVYNSLDNVIYKREDGITTYIDENAVFDSVFEGYMDGTTTSNSGRLLLEKGNYKVIVDDGSIAFMQDGDYAGILTNNSQVTVEKTASTALKISSNDSGNATVVIRDNNDSNQFTSVKTDVITSDKPCYISLTGDNMTVNTDTDQNVNINVITENGKRTISDISADSIDNLDVDGTNSADNANNAEHADSSTSDVINQNNNSADSQTNGGTENNIDSQAAGSVNTADVTITQNKKTVKSASLKKKAQKVTITVENTDGQITATNKSSKKLKKYMSVSVKNGKVICKLKKGAPKGTYKVKVMVTGDSKQGDINKTIKIKVK